ncbi:nucleotidyltransferase family protein [Rhodospirillaceae bacterium]|nr:nucleotidyltransferase family protein [Alphaproteobacteria bacterium]MDC1442525.1 nucleotidyltransferase family protein [Rhodospirillaceae bacterium]
MFLDKLPVNPCVIPNSAMILAAGLGKRMLPLTERIPKPMLVISGLTILDRAIEHLLKAGVKKIVINTSHLAAKLEEHIIRRSDSRLVLSTEEELLETGGGVRRALPSLGKEAFYVINGDSVWVDGMKSPLLRLAETWDANQMDVLLMLAPLSSIQSFQGLGDFTMDQLGRLSRRSEKNVAPFSYMGISIVNPAILLDAPEGAFSLNWAYDRAITSNRLYGIVHDGLWYHISTPTDLELARSRFINGHSPPVPFF